VALGLAVLLQKSEQPQICHFTPIANFGFS